MMTIAGIAFSGEFLYLLRVSFKVLKGPSNWPCSARGRVNPLTRSIVQEV